MDLPVFLPRKVVQDTAADLSRFGAEVISKQVLDWTSDAERNVPYVRGKCAFQTPVTRKPLLMLAQGRGEMLLVKEQTNLSQVKDGEIFRLWA